MNEQARFVEAELQFQFYTSEHRAGRLDADAYNAAVNGLRVTDDQGRFWMQQAGSGAWHLWLGDRWVPATPYQAPPPVAPARAPVSAAPASSSATAVQRNATPQTPAGSEEITNGAGCLRQTVKYGLITLLIFGLIGAALMIFVEDFPPEGLLGVALAAVISFVISARTLSSHWEGEIVNLYTKRVDVSSGDDDPEYRDVLFATIRQPSGKARDQRAMPEWRVGDYLRKRQGETQIEHLPRS